MRTRGCKVHFTIPTNCHGHMDSTSQLFSMENAWVLLINLSRDGGYKLGVGTRFVCAGMNDNGDLVRQQQLGLVLASGAFFQ